MKQQCAYDFNCHQVATYVDANGNCFCRRHRNMDDETVVHIDWKKCTGCGQIRRLYKKKCVPCSKAPPVNQVTATLPSACSTPRPRNRVPSTPLPGTEVSTETTSSINMSATPRPMEMSDYFGEDKDKQMIKMLKSLSKTRPVEVTVYRFKICPPIAEETD